MMLLKMMEKLVVFVVLLRGLRYLLRKGLKGSLKAALNALTASAKVLPGVSGVIDQEIKKEEAKIEQGLLGDGDPTARMQLPDNGMPADMVVSEAKSLLDTGSEGFFSEGKLWGGIYHDTREEHTELPKLQSDIFALYNNTNSLYPSVFPAVRKFEAEIIAMTVDLLHGTEKGAVGLLTSGGTESILIAVHGYREQAKTRGIEHPEIICCVTAHPAIDKACHYFGLRLVKVDADPTTQQLTPSACAAAMTSNTIALYASAPTFPHGVVDPVPQLAAFALEKDVGLHVDNCLGGFWLSYMQKQGLGRMTPFDFRVPGVTTISIDIHKYGFASKGASVVTFADPALRRLTYCPVMDGTSLYITPTMQGSRSGAVMACAWATMLHMGHDGYLEAARLLHSLHERLCNEVDKIPGLRVLCTTDLCIVPITTDEVDIYALASLLDRKGWNMFTTCKPKGMSVCIGERHQEILEVWLEDLKECFAQLKADPSIKPEGDAAVYGATDSLPDEIVQTVMKSYVDIKLSVKPKKQ